MRGDSWGYQARVPQGNLQLLSQAQSRSLHFLAHAQQQVWDIGMRLGLFYWICVPVARMFGVRSVIPETVENVML